jgi:hypothetical protein
VSTNTFQIPTCSSELWKSLATAIFNHGLTRMGKV